MISAICGFFLGTFVGAMIGVFTAALAAAAAREDVAREPYAQGRADERSGAP